MIINCSRIILWTNLWFNYWWGNIWGSWLLNCVSHRFKWWDLKESFVICRYSFVDGMPLRTQKTGWISGGRVLPVFLFEAVQYIDIFRTDSFGQTFLCEVNVGELFQVKLPFLLINFCWYLKVVWPTATCCARQSFRWSCWIRKIQWWKRAGRIWGSRPICYATAWVGGSPSIDQPNLRTKMISKWSKWIWLKIFLLVPQMAGWFYNLWPNLVQKLSPFWAMDIWWTVVTRTWTQCLQWTPTYHADFWTPQSIHVCESWRRVIFWHIFSLLVDLHCSGSRFEVICAGPRHQVRITCYLLTTLSTCCSSCLHQKLFQCHLPTSGWIRPRRHLAHHVWYMPAAETHWSPRLQYSIPFSHADCKAGILWPESLYYRTDGFLRECVHQKQIQKNKTDSPFLNQNYKLYIICVLVISNLFHILRWLFCVFFLPNLFGCRFASKHFQLSRAPTKLHGAERFEERSATNLLPVPRSLRSQRKERNETAWESHRVGNFPPQKKGEVWVGTFFPPNSSHPTFVFSRFFIAGLVESGMESLYEHVHNAGKARSRNNQWSIGRLCHPELQQIHHT